MALNPVGSAEAAPFEVLAAGARAGGEGRLLEITGPAKLLESLFEVGASKPISASFMVDEVGAGAAVGTGAGAAADGTGLTRLGETGGRR